MAAPQLKTQRLAANDLFSTYPNGQGGLEGALAAIFGFTPNVDITVQPLQLDNSGRITTSLPIQKALEPPVPGASTTSNGIGFQVTNTSNSKIGIWGQNTSQGGQLFTVAEPYLGQAFTPVFSVDMNTGAFTGYTTQDGSSQPLVAPTGGVKNGYYYNSLGQWAIPGFLPFNGTRLNASVTTVSGGSSGFQKWTTSTDRGATTFDVGSHFDGVNKLTSVTAGKYFVHVQLPVVGNGGVSVDANIELQDDGGNNLAFASVKSSSVLSEFLAMSTVWNASSGSSWLKVNCTANAVVGASGANFGGDNGILGSSHLFDGTITFFQIG